MSELNHSSFVTSPQTAAAASLLVLNQGHFSNSRESLGTNSTPHSLFSAYSFNVKEELADSKSDGPRVELYSMADETGAPGQGVVPINAFPEGADQTSPITPVTHAAPSQILPYRPSASSGDAMLSAINYNENEILQDGAFDVSVAATLPNLDDGLLGTQDLFDGEGNVNDSYEMEGLSPHSFNDPGSGLVDGSLSSVIDSDSLGSLDQARTPDSSKQKKKSKPQKMSPGGAGAGSPGRPGVLTCPTCNKSFNNSSALAKHRLTHSDERKYVCNLCQKAFKRQDHLNGHLMTHRDKKPYECTVENCQKSYCDARSLRRHLENHHSQTPEQIQSAIAKVASNAAAVIAAAAASNNASIKASTTTTTTTTHVNSVQAGSGQSTSGQTSSNVATVPPLNSEGQQVALLLGQDGNSTNTQFSESSTPLTSPSYQVQPQHQPYFQYEQPAQQPAVLQQPQVLQQQSDVAAQILATQQPVKVEASLGGEGGTDQLSHTISSLATLAQQPVEVQQAWQEALKKLTQPAVVTHQPHSHSPRSEEPSPGYSPISPVPTTNLGGIIPTQPQGHRIFASPGAGSTGSDKSGEDKSVICTKCDRTFKNVQALNGHMRLHGGYFKKLPMETKEEKKSKRVPTIREMVPLQGASTQPLATLTQPFPASTDQVAVYSQARLNDAYSGQPNPMMSPLEPESPQGPAAPQDQLQIHRAAQQQQQEQQQMQHQMQQLQLQFAKEQHQNQLQQQQEQKIQEEQQIQNQIQQQLQQLQMEKQALEQQMLQQAKVKQEQAQLQYIHVQQQQQQAGLQQQQQQQQQRGSQPGSMPPSPQVPQSPHLQRQSSVESAMYQHSVPQQQPVPYQHGVQQDTAQDHNHPQFTGKIPVSMAIRLQQMAHRQELVHRQEHLVQRPEQDVVQRQELAQLQDQLVQNQGHQLAQRASEHFQQHELAQRQQEQELAHHQELVHRHEQMEKHLQAAQRHEQRQNNPGHIHNEQNLHPSVQQLTSASNVTLHSFPQLQTPSPSHLSSASVQSNLQNAFAQAQIPSFALQTPTQKTEMPSLPIQRLIDPSAISASQVTLVSTTSSQEMTVSQILNTLENPESLARLQNLLPGTTQTSAIESTNFEHKPEVSLEQRGVDSSNIYAGVNSSDTASVYHSVDMGSMNKSQDYDLDRTLDDISDIYKKEMSKAAKKENPFSFPSVDVEMTDHTNGEQSGKLLDSKTIQIRHKELKRRLSLGNEIQTAPALPNFPSQKPCAITPSKHGASNSAFSENRQRIRSKSGDDFKFFRSKSEEHSFMRPRSRTEVSPMKSKSVDKFPWERSGSYILSKSDGAQHGFGQFRTPNLLTGPPKMRRKHRPAPLFIPPYRGSGGFQSNLRSPRVPQGVEGRGHTPPPYTPPPMLSPNRSGSGLFCSLSGWKPSMTPKSAPITPRSSLLLSARTLSYKEEGDSESKEDEASAGVPPETDVLPHVNIGSQYQAEIPPYNGCRSEALQAESKEDLLWDPAIMTDISDEDVQYYQDLACSAAVNGNGFNVEYGLHVLNIYKGNIQTAMLKLMAGKISLPKDHSLLSYTYQETDTWTAEEIERYQQALWKCDKDFFALSKEMGTKTTKECVQFYYLWKKVCPDEHKRLRLIRRRREQERLYNLRSTQQQQPSVSQPNSQPSQPGLPEQTVPSGEQVTNYEEYEDMESESGASTEVDEQNDNDMDDKLSDDKMSTASSVSASPTPIWPCNYPDCNATFNSKQGLNGHVRIHKGASGNKGTNPPRTFPAGEVTGPGRPVKPVTHPGKSPMYDEYGNEIFPCKLCGRVFTKVKSRSAHMKSHRVIDNDKNKNKTVAPSHNNYEVSLNKFQGSPHR